MMILVVPGISSRNAFRIFASVAVSTALVESSRMRTFGLRKTQIGGWRRLDAREGDCRGDCSAGNIAQQLLKISLIHICSLRRRKV